jgi:hypothetical protein
MGGLTWDWRCQSGCRLVVPTPVGTGDRSVDGPAPLPRVGDDVTLICRVEYERRGGWLCSGGDLSLRCEAAVEFRPDRGPLACDDRVDNGVANGSIGHNHVAAQDSVLFGAQAFDRFTGAVVEPVRAEFDRDAAHVVEGACQ